MNSISDEESKALINLRKYLVDNNWQIREDSSEDLFKSMLSNELCPTECFFKIRVDLQEFLFYIVPNIVVTNDKLPAVAEYIARVNSGMRIGNFEIDFRNGHVRFKSSINFKGDRLSLALIKGVVGPALKAFETYFPGVAKVIADIATPLQAINAIDYKS